MYPIIFSVGRIHVYTHGFMITVGALLGGLLIYYLAKQKEYNTNIIFDLAVYSLISGLIGARILYVILYFKEFQNLREMLYVWNGGLVSYGGMLGGFIFAYIFLKSKKENIYKWFDLGVLGILIGWAFGRIGCLLNGDSYGIISTSKIAIWGRIPTQLFETIWTLIVAGSLYLLLRKKNIKLPDGVVFWSGIALYSVGRFVVDFWRDDQVFAFSFKAGQIGSLVIFIICVASVYIIFQKGRRSNGAKKSN